MATQTTARATNISSRLSANIASGRKAGESGIMVDPVTIITIIATLLPYIIKCFDPADGEEAKEYVRNRFVEANRNDKYFGYDKRLVKGATRQARVAGRKNSVSLTWDQATDIAVATLDDIRLGDAQQASLVIRENEGIFQNI